MSRPHIRLLTTPVALALLAALVALPAALAPHAEAFIYWTDITRQFPYIGRANFDGSNQQILIKAVTGAGDMAVDQGHLYWGAPFTIARADLDGTEVDQDFIAVPGSPRGIAVDGSHLYWGANLGMTIGRANLDGSGVDQSFITTTELTSAVAVDDDHVYWTAYQQGATIGRANLDGSGVDHSFIRTPGGFVPTGLAVDADHIYWTNDSSSMDAGTIGRAELDGTAVDDSFISGLQGVGDVAVDANHVYWTQIYPSGSIGRAGLNGTGVDQSFIRRVTPLRLAVDGLADATLAGKASAARTQRQSGSRIVVKAKVKAKEQLTAKATGKIKVNPAYKLKPQKVRVAAGKTKTLKLKPQKKAATKIVRALKHGEKATTRLKVKLTDRAGNSATEKLRVRLKRG